METKQNSSVQVQAQCPDCKNFYKNRNTLQSHRSGSCPVRNSSVGRPNIVIKEEPRPTPTPRTVNKQPEFPREVQSSEQRQNTPSTSVIKHNKTFSVIRGKQPDAEFNEDDLAYWREFEQSQFKYQWWTTHKSLINEDINSSRRWFIISFIRSKYRDLLYFKSSFYLIKYLLHIGIDTVNSRHIKIPIKIGQSSLPTSLPVDSGERRSRALPALLHCRDWSHQVLLLLGLRLEAQSGVKPFLSAQLLEPLLPLGAVLLTPEIVRY